MRNKTIHRLTAGLSSFIIICLILCAAAILPASAADKGFVLDSERDIEISVVYEGNEPTVTVSGPNKKTYTKDSQYDKVERSSGILNLYIKGAAAGRWNVSTSSDAKIAVLSWNEELSVSSFKISGVKDDRITAVAVVSLPENVSYDWKIYAIPDFKTTGMTEEHQVMLRETSGRTNEKSETELNVQDLPDGNWMIAMEAVYTYPDGIEVSGTAQADEPVTISGHTATGADSDFFTVTDLSEGTVTVDWTQMDESDIYYDEMLVSVIGAKDEPVFYSTFERDVKQAQIVDNEQGSRTLTIRLLPLRNGVCTVMYSRKVTFEPKFSIKIDTPEATGDMMAKISYDIGDKEKPMDVTVNGSTNRYRIQGKSSISVALNAMENNDITARCYISDTDAYQVTKSVTVRSDPPVLTLYGISDKMVTNDEVFSVSGKTDPDAKLTLNDDEISVDEDGSFTAEAELELGDNSLVFCAENAYGIRTTRTLSVNRTESDVIDLKSSGKNDLGWLPAVGGSALALLSAIVLILVVLLSKKRGKKLPAIILNAVAAMFGLAAVIFGASAGYCFWMKNVVNSSVTGDELVEKLKTEDYQGVADKLDQMDVWQSRGVTMIICAAVALALMILLIILIAVISKKLRDRPEKPKRPKKQKPAYSEAPPIPQNDPFPYGGLPTEPPAPFEYESKAAAPDNSPAEQARFCPNCGAPIDVDSPFCGFCGFKL